MYMYLMTLVFLNVHVFDDPSILICKYMYLMTLVSLNVYIHVFDVYACVDDMMYFCPPIGCMLCLKAKTDQIILLCFLRIFLDV